ncbi:MAG: polysaccharide deacetylase [Pseudomonadota bacterium]
MPDPDLPPWEWLEARWRGAVEKVRAGRSLKPASWPGGARCAVALSFDSDHETLTLRRGVTSPGELSGGQYGARQGVPRILDVLRRREIQASFYVPAVVAKLYPDEQRRVIAEGHETGLHSWIHEMNSQLPPEVERDLQLRAADVLEEVCGVRPVGIRTPSWDFSDVTLAITREMELEYDSSLMADDDPYELVEDGEATGIVEIPVEWIRDDAPYWMFRLDGPRPYLGPRDVLDIWVREFEGALAEGGLFQLTMHPHISGHRSRIRVLEELLERIAGERVWVATHAEVARWCRETAGLKTP